MSKRDKKIVISIFSIVAVIALAAGSVYAYFSFVTNSGVVQTTDGKLDIDYNISEPNLTGVLIPSATRSGGVLEVATAKLNTGSVPAAINFYITPTSITGFPLSALSYDVDVLNTSNEVINNYTGTFSSASLNTPLKIIDGYNLSTNLLTFNIYIWLDGSKINNENFNSNNSFSATITADSVQITGDFTPDPNPITDYEYTLFPKSETNLDRDYVLLKKYIGTSPTVIVPNTYTVGNVEYKTIFGMTSSPPNSTFKDNTIITDVVLPSEYLITYSTSSLGQSSISNNSMAHFFSGCTSLVNVSVIPDSVTYMDSTFFGCTSLENAPIIPSSVTRMMETFLYCTSLENAPIIPSSVTNMTATFRGCTNLEGTIRIESSNVSYSRGYSAGYPFDTVDPIIKPITVEVPAGSTTYTNINNKKPDNVTVTTFTP